jgi:hypothetical protein
MKNVLQKSVEKIKTHISCSITFFSKLLPLRNNVDKYCRADFATGNMKAG